MEHYTASDLDRRAGYHKEMQESEHLSNDFHHPQVLVNRKKLHRLTLWEIFTALTFIGLFFTFFYAVVKEYSVFMINVLVSTVSFYTLYTKSLVSFFCSICSFVYLLMAVILTYMAGLSSDSVISPLNISDGTFSPESIQPVIHSTAHLIGVERSMTIFIIHTILLSVSIIYFVSTLCDHYFHKTFLTTTMIKKPHFQSFHRALRFHNRYKIVFWEIFLFLMGVIFFSTLVHLSIRDLFVGIPLFLVFMLGVLVRFFLKPQPKFYGNPQWCTAKAFVNLCHNTPHEDPPQTPLRNKTFIFFPVIMKNSMDSFPCTPIQCLSLQPDSSHRTKSKYTFFLNTDTPPTSKSQRYILSIMFFASSLLLVLVVILRLTLMDSPTAILQRWGLPSLTGSSQNNLASERNGVNSVNHENNASVISRLLAESAHESLESWRIQNHKVFPMMSVSDFAESQIGYASVDTVYRKRQLEIQNKAAANPSWLETQIIHPGAALCILSFHTGLLGLLSLVCSTLLAVWAIKPKEGFNKFLVNNIILQTHYITLHHLKTQPASPQGHGVTKQQSLPTIKNSPSVSEHRVSTTGTASSNILVSSKEDNSEKRYLLNCNTESFNSFPTAHTGSQGLEEASQNTSTDLDCFSISVRHSVIISEDEEGEEAQTKLRKLHDPIPLILIEKNGRLITTEADGLSLLPTTDDFDLQSLPGQIFYPSLDSSTHDIVELPTDIAYIPSETGLEQVLDLNPSQPLKTRDVKRPQSLLHLNNPYASMKFSGSSQGTYLLPQTFIWTPRKESSEV